MSEYAEVRPVPGRLVFVPESGRPLSPEGERVELTPFWRRRLMDGDVEDVSPKNLSENSPSPLERGLGGEAQFVPQSEEETGGEAQFVPQSEEETGGEAQFVPEETPAPEPAENEEDI